MNYKGTIIEESLINAKVLEKAKILSTEVEQATESFKTPWLTKWTLHTVEVAEDEAGEIAKEISEVIDESHDHPWYADYKNNEWHYIIFPHKIFKIRRDDDAGYKEVGEYGISLGIPAHQVDFSPDID